MFFENLVSAFMLALGVAGMIYVQGFTRGSAKIMPEIGFAIMILFSLVILIRNLMRAKAHAAAGMTPAAAEDCEEPQARKKRLALFGVKMFMILAFFLSFKLVNYFITAPIAIISVALLSGVNWKQAVFTAAVVTAGIYGVFILWLNVFM